MHKTTAFAFIIALTACGGSTTSEDGSACEASEECATELCAVAFLDGTEIAGGTCTQGCTWNEDLSDTCPDGQVCLRYRATGEMYCYLDCETDEDCRTEDGWTCVQLNPTTSACIPPL